MDARICFSSNVSGVRSQDEGHDCKAREIVLVVDDQPGVRYIIGSIAIGRVFNWCQ